MQKERKKKANMYGRKYSQRLTNSRRMVVERKFITELYKRKPALSAIPWAKKTERK